MSRKIVRFYLISALVLMSSMLYAEEPATPETISVGGKTLTEWRKMAGTDAPVGSGSILFLRETADNPLLSTRDACRASIEKQQEVILHNLVNRQTVGYKRVIPVQTEMRSPQTGRLLGCQVIALRTDFSQGPLVKTGRPLDLAIEGPGFFALRDPKNDRRRLFTRQGYFSLNKYGTLGLKRGETFYPLEPKITMTDIDAPDSPAKLSKLPKLYVFEEDSSLVRCEKGFFELSEKLFQKISPDFPTGKIRRGMLEFSNVNKATELREWDMTVKLLKETE